MNSLALYDSFLPLTHITIAFKRSPHTYSIPFALSPLTRVEFTIWPSELSFTLFLIIFEYPIVLAMFSQLYSFIFRALFPTSLENTATFDLYSCALTLLMTDLSKKY
jgi:hypothetical protein